MVKCCVAASCSNTYKDGVSLFQFPRDAVLPGSSGLRKFKRLAPNGRGQAIVPFYAVNISQATIAARFGIKK